MFDAIVIGTGCAGYSTADWLYKNGIKNICIISENKNSGTSRNTGSDKQTYYKIAMDGKGEDSASKMAKAMITGGSANGELAYIECLNSLKCFLRLVDYGVNFPKDEFGAYIGYKTDNDDLGRGSSIGPYTSKKMTEKLEYKVLEENKTTLLDRRLVVKISKNKKGNANGVICYNKDTKKAEYIAGKTVIACTGAPACIYSNSVYPHSQHGMTGVLIDAGCEMMNFTEWQYGLASTKFRWNVSGSYMQVIPRFVSIDSNGNENEFLLEKHDNEIYSDVFLKGYQWPFEIDRVKGSAKIDILVLNELNKGNRVYLDYTKNPKNYSFDCLSNEAKDYLINSNANLETPFERLVKLNSKAIDLYRDNNIDIEKEYLEIAVCAQHNNGGIKVDNNWETNVKNLFAVGEVAGTFGISRPGGSALNSTQVGGLRVSEYLKNNLPKIDQENTSSDLNNIQSLIDNFKEKENNFKEIPNLMSKFASINRYDNEIQNIINKIDNLLDNNLSAKTLIEYFKAKDMLLSAKCLCDCINKTMKVTGSRGSAFYYKNDNLIEEKTDYRKYMSIYKNDKIEFVKNVPIPTKKVWFETLLQKLEI